MKTFQCMSCGEIYDAPEVPDFCPFCAIPSAVIPPQQMPPKYRDKKDK